MTKHETEQLAELITRKLDCLTQLRDMGKRQLEFAQTDRVTDLLDVLSTKQRVLMVLQQVERALDPFRDQDPDQRPWPTPEARGDCARQLEACEVLFEEIMTQEKQSEDELLRRRNQVAVELDDIRRASQATGAYTARSDPKPGQIDLTSEA